MPHHQLIGPVAPGSCLPKLICSARHVLGGLAHFALYWQLYKRYLEGSGEHVLLRELIETHSLGRLEQHAPSSERQTERFRNGGEQYNISTLLRRSITISSPRSHFCHLLQAVT